MFNDKSILITGGTGSFGQKFVSNILSNYSPSKIVVFSRDELKQFEMQNKFNSDRIRFFLGDVRDRDRLVQAMQGIDYVVHAAALKQVTAAEYNPMECIKTNIYGCENVVYAAIQNNVSKVITLSTDKAANPVNLYGATKLAADKLTVAANNIVGKTSTHFAVVRYGNVAGSRGSVIPYFDNLIQKGEKVLPITDTRMTRFWITLEQGVDFVIRSFERMHGGEVFVPKIPSVYITDLVEAFKELYHVNFEMNIVGIRAGEKLHEVMCPKDDAYLNLTFKDHYVIKPSIRFNELEHDYTSNCLGEIGEKVEDGFEYISNRNEKFLEGSEILQQLKTFCGKKD